MGKLEDALENAAGQSSGGGLGETVGQGGVRLQQGNRGASAEEQIQGEGTLPESGGEGSARTMPTSPEAGQNIPE